MSKLNVGDKIVCTYAPVYAVWMTVGKEYQVKAAGGDVNLMFGDIIPTNGFNFIDDNGQMAYQANLQGLHAIFEIVK